MSTLLDIIVTEFVVEPISKICTSSLSYIVIDDRLAVLVRKIRLSSIDYYGTGLLAFSDDLFNVP